MVVKLFFIKWHLGFEMTIWKKKPLMLHQLHQKITKTPQIFETVKTNPKLFMIFWIFVKFILIICESFQGGWSLSGISDPRCHFLKNKQSTPQKIMQTIYKILKEHEKNSQNPKNWPRMSITFVSLLEFIGIFINQLWNFPGGTGSVIVANVPSWIRDATLF